MKRNHYRKYKKDDGCLEITTKLTVSNCTCLYLSWTVTLAFKSKKLNWKNNADVISNNGFINISCNLISIKKHIMSYFII